MLGKNILGPIMILVVLAIVSASAEGKVNARMTNLGKSLTVPRENLAVGDDLSVSLSPTGPEHVDYGSNVTFIATASGGTEPYTYQWYFEYPNGIETEVAEAYNQSSWTCYSIVSYGDHVARIQVTDGNETQVNASAIISLKDLTVSTEPQSSSSVYINNTLSIKATLTGGMPPYKIQWYRNDTEVLAVENETTVPFAFNTLGLERVIARATDTGQRTAAKEINVTIVPLPKTMIKILPTDNIFYSYETHPGDKFIVNATVQNVIDLQLWEIKVTWDPTLLNFSRIWVPNDHVFSPIDDSIHPGELRARHIVRIDPIVEAGSVTWGSTYLNTPYWTFNGTGTLAQIELKIREPTGQLPLTSYLTFANRYFDTFLLNGSLYDIEFMTRDGTFSYLPASIALTEVASSKGAVGQGFTVAIGVVVRNHGASAVTFNVTAYHNNTAIVLSDGNDYKTVSLAGGNSTTVIFVWNTTGVVKGNYLLSAYAGPFIGETYLEDNSCEGGSILVTIAGDVTGASGVPDNIVDMQDINAICQQYGTTPSRPNWNPNVDINDDKKVNMRDIGIACRNFAV